jgi:N-methylhydantoinase B
MNNLTIGNARLTTPFTYYETCGGGHGASAQGPGASGQQIAMTNTRNTPAEILETYYPLRLWSYYLREHSGGGGRHRGGDGVVRELELLCQAQISLLASRRRLPAAGLEGGEAAQTGLDLADGRRLEPPWSGWLQAGTRLVLQTPGGGGWGSAS